jgi:hypothetical protein
MTKRQKATAVLAFGLVAVTPTLAYSAEAGRVKVASGDAYIMRANKQIPARVGDVVFEADSLRTGGEGRIGVTLNDDTRVSIGPDSEVRLSRFSYGGGDGAFGLVLKVVRGVTAYVSGRIAKLSPDAVRLETPAAIVGVRGTTLVVRAEP